MSRNPHHFSLSSLPLTEVSGIISVLKTATAIVQAVGDSVPQRVGFGNGHRNVVRPLRVKIKKIIAVNKSVFLFFFLNFP